MNLEISSDASLISSQWHVAETWLEKAGVRINGQQPWDVRVHNDALFDRVLAKGHLAWGESYMDGWWDCDSIDELTARLIRAGLDKQLHRPDQWLAVFRAIFMNLQSVPRSWQVGYQHYDLGNDLYEAMLDPYMAYSCGYWAHADSLETAQESKLELICSKLGLQPGMRLLDIGCGWGSLMRFAAERYGVSCVGLTVSHEQAQWGAQKAHGLPIRFELTDYRLFNETGVQKFDRIASVGMFEHVGSKNYPAYFAMARRSLTDDGLFLLHSIGKNQTDVVTDPWIEKCIFPTGILPSVKQMAAAVEPEFVLEDWHNFGADYDRTLMAWHARFEAAWPRLQSRYDQRFYRMWRYYLLCCAGSFRARDSQLWQLVLSPRGVPSGYRRPLF